MCVYKLLSFSVSGSVFAFLLLMLSSYPLYPKVQHKAYAIKKINGFYFLIIFLWVYTCSRQNVMCLCSCTSQDACNQLSIIADTHTQVAPWMQKWQVFPAEDPELSNATQVKWAYLSYKFIMVTDA